MPVDLIWWRIKNKQALFSIVLRAVQFTSVQETSVNPTRTGVFGESVKSKGVFRPRVYSFVCKPRVFKFDTQLKMGKIYHKKHQT